MRLSYNEWFVPNEWLNSCICISLQGNNGYVAQGREQGLRGPHSSSDRCGHCRSLRGPHRSSEEAEGLSIYGMLPSISSCSVENKTLTNKGYFSNEWFQTFPAGTECIIDLSWACVLSVYCQKSETFAFFINCNYWHVGLHKLKQVYMRLHYPYTRSVVFLSVFVITDLINYWIIFKMVLTSYTHALVSFFWRWLVKYGWSILLVSWFKVYSIPPDVELFIIIPLMKFWYEAGVKNSLKLAPMNKRMPQPPKVPPPQSRPASSSTELPDLFAQDTICYMGKLGIVWIYPGCSLIHSSAD